MTFGKPGVTVDTRDSVDREERGELEGDLVLIHWVAEDEGRNALWEMVRKSAFSYRIAA